MKSKFLVALAAILLAGFQLEASTRQSISHKVLSRVVSRKVDILFVIDNSGSMSTLQTTLVQGIPEFVSKLKAANLDFHIAVTGTDAWRAKYQSNIENKNILSRFRPGQINFNPPLKYETNSGVFVVDTQTPSLDNVLQINLHQGISGTGDERAFDSVLTALEFPENSDFRRPDAKLSILVISDEDDFSSNTSAYVAGQFNEELVSEPAVLAPNTHPQSLYALYQDPRLTPISQIKEHLDQLAGAENYSVNMIGILDQPCKAQLSPSYGGLRIGRRYLQLVQEKRGLEGSLCKFEASMNAYASILTTPPAALPYEIRLDRKPLPGTLVIKINGRLILENSENGWSFDDQTLILTLHGEAVPEEGDIVSVTYDFSN